MASRDDKGSTGHHAGEEKEKLEHYKNLKKTRTFIQDQVTRFIHFFNSKDTISKNHALTMNTQLDILWEKYQENQNEIVQLFDEDKVPSEEEEHCNELENNYYDLKLRIDDILEGSSSTGKEEARDITHMPFTPYQKDETVDNYLNRLETYFTLYNTDDEEIKKLIFLSSLSPKLHQLVYDIVSPSDPKLLQYHSILSRFREYLNSQSDAVQNYKAHRFY